MASTGGDDVVTSFSIGTLSNGDPCVEYDPVHDLLYVVKSRTQVVMMSTTGQQLGTLDISAANARKVAGLALAPSSDDANQMSLYIVDRGVDNDSNPNENDGKLYEFRLDHCCSPDRGNRPLRQKSMSRKTAQRFSTNT